MRTKSYEFNNEHPNNDSIIRDIRIMAGEELNMDLSEIASMRSEYRAGATQRSNNNHRRRPQRNNNGRKPQHHAQAHSNARGNKPHPHHRSNGHGVQHQ
jgi:hypothetical protein